MGGLIHPIIDIGVNLTNKRFKHDLDDVIERAADVGVEMMLVTGTSEGGSRSAVELCDRYPTHLRCTVGVHPHHAKDVDRETLDILSELAKRPAVVAMGECGLDFDRDFSPRDAQEQAFEDQLALASALGLPVFLHERAAHERFMGILKEHLPQLPGAVVHCFTGGPDEARAYLDLGCYLGITGWICDERRGDALREAARIIPLDRMMVETDAPYLTPRTMRPKPRGGRNEPAFLPVVVEALAEETRRTPRQIAHATRENTLRFFKLKAREPDPCERR